MRYRLDTLRHMWSPNLWRTTWDVLTSLPAFCLYMLTIAGFFFYVAILFENANKKVFMDECLQDLKQYECTAMWRGH